MKKIILTSGFFLLFTISMNAQIHFGIKAGINYNSDTFQPSEELNKLSNFNTKSKTGYHAGLWSRIKLPVIGLYIRPELVYTALKSKVTSTINKETNYDFQKIDIPVLLGYNFLKVGNIFLGPSFQYIIDNKFNVQDIKDLDGKGFTVGMQLGAGLEISRLGLDIRWERGFSDVEASFLTKTTNTKRKFDTRVNQIIVGLSYRF